MLVTTIHGNMDDSLLRRVEGSLDDENEHTEWIEYWLDGKIVHRSAHVTLKKPVIAFSEVASLGG